MVRAKTMPLHEHDTLFLPPLRCQENALDPSHASYVHNRVISRREDAAPMRMRLSSEVDPQRGFELEHGGYSRSQQEGGMRAKRWFVPPCTIRCAEMWLVWCDKCLL